MSCLFLSPADFSDPVINPSINRHCLNQLKLTCSSRGGYPKPKMYIFVNNELVELNYHSESDNQTQLINIAGTLLINVTEDILLINCSVVYLDVQLSTSLSRFFLILYIKILPSPGCCSFVKCSDSLETAWMKIQNV